MPHVRNQKILACSLMRLAVTSLLRECHGVAPECSSPFLHVPSLSCTSLRLAGCERAQGFWGQLTAHSLLCEALWAAVESEPSGPLISCS